MRPGLFSRSPGGYQGYFPKDPAWVRTLTPQLHGYHGLEAAEVLRTWWVGHQDGLKASAPISRTFVYRAGFRDGRAARNRFLLLTRPEAIRQ